MYFLKKSSRKKSIMNKNARIKMKSRKKKVEKEKFTAAGMRQKVMESQGETKTEPIGFRRKWWRKALKKKIKLFWSNRIPTGQKWARSRVKTKTARNWWENVKPMWTSTPRFHGVNAKYTRKHHEKRIESVAQQMKNKGDQNWPLFIF